MSWPLADTAVPHIVIPISLLNTHSKTWFPPSCETAQKDVALLFIVLNHKGISEIFIATKTLLPDWGVKAIDKSPTWPNLINLQLQFEFITTSS